jgi:anti-sigma B factor antagonist
VTGTTGEAALQVKVQEPIPNKFVLAPVGELDMATAPVLDEAVAGVLAHGRVEAVVVDLSGVQFLDSSGIRTLLQARRAASERGAGFTVTQPNDSVALVLRAAALDHVFQIEGQPPLGV